MLRWRGQKGNQLGEQRGADMGPGTGGRGAGGAVAPPTLRQGGDTQGTRIGFGLGCQVENSAFKICINEWKIKQKCAFRMHDPTKEYQIMHTK